MVSLATLLTFSLILAGCGGSKDDASSDGKKVLKVWAMGGEGKVLSQMTKIYEEKNPGIKVEVQAIPWDTAHDKLVTAVASKSGPDVVQMGTTWVPEFASANALLDLTSYIDKYPNLKADNFFDGAVETTKYDKKTVGIPWYVETRAMYYRTDLLASVGYPEGPKTWDELKDASEKYVAKNPGKFAMSIDAKDQVYTALYAWQNGSDLIDSNRQPQFNKPEYVEAVNFLKDFYTKKLTPTGTDMDIFAAFKDGTIPMFISGPWMIQSIKDKAPEIDGKWAVKEVPTKKTNTSSIGGADLSVFSYSKNVDEAVKFISFMSDKDNQVKWYDISKALPAVKTAWTDAKFKDPMIAAYGRQLEHTRSTPAIKEWETIAQAAIASFEQITIGGADTQTELDKLNAKANEILGNK
nr:sugar ABC transporter substrate-binding protein [Paenibacillus shirakamiensis]